MYQCDALNKHFMLQLTYLLSFLHVKIHVTILNTCIYILQFTVGIIMNFFYVIHFSGFVHE